MPDEIMQFIINRMEDELIELMGLEGYHKFAKQVAKDALKHFAEGMKDAGMKKFIIDNFDKITGEEE